ncbi:MAG: carbohydrate kinase family protein [Clostridia bacterium]|nr:carbohydrate kinase family protein [Clostridia bacterium]
MNTVVIGVVFMDIKGFPFGKYDRRGTNLGNIMMTHGGVARNVAENLANLGSNVSFISMFDKDAMGQEVKSRLQDAGVNTDNAVITDEKGMGMWLAVFNERGDLDGSVSHMPSPAPIEALFEEKGEEIIKNADNIVLEMDVSEKLSERVFALAEKYNKNVYTIVANMSVILARPDLMAKNSCIILNEIEAGRLFGAYLQHLTHADMLEKVYPLGEKMGVKKLVVTMGERGSVYIDYRTGEKGFCPPRPTVVMDTTGAGDAFFSAAVEAFSHGKTLAEAVECGTRLASLTLSTSESVCPRLGASFFCEPCNFTA